jgi:hypothetical protein
VGGGIRLIFTAAVRCSARWTPVGGLLMTRWTKEVLSWSPSLVVRYPGAPASRIGLRGFSPAAREGMIQMTVRDRALIAGAYSCAVI